MGFDFDDNLRSSNKSGGNNYAFNPASAIGDIANGFANIVQVFQDGETKRELIIQSGKKLAAEIENNKTVRANENLCILKEYEVSIKQIEANIKDNELNYQNELAKINNSHDIEMEKLKSNHDIEMEKLKSDDRLRMRQLDIIADAIKMAYDIYKNGQNNRYQDGTIIYTDDSLSVVTTALNQIQNAAVILRNDVIRQ